MIIEIAEKKIGIKFNNYAIEQLSTVKNSGNSYYAFLTTLIWCAYLGHCFVKQSEPELDFEAISDWVDSSINDENIAEQIRKIFELYQQSPAYQRMQKKSELNGSLTEPLENV